MAAIKFLRMGSISTIVCSAVSFVDCDLYYLLQEYQISLYNIYLSLICLLSVFVISHLYFWSVSSLFILSLDEIFSNFVSFYLFVGEWFLSLLLQYLLNHHLSILFCFYITICLFTTILLIVQDDSNVTWNMAESCLYVVKLIWREEYTRKTNGRKIYNESVVMEEGINVSKQSIYSLRLIVLKIYNKSVLMEDGINVSKQFIVW